MKKFFIFLATLLVSLNSFAQFGILGGLTSSNASVKDAVADYKSINQFHVGVAYKFATKGGVLAIQPALTYNVKGARIENIKSVGDLNLDFKTGYIELPVQVQAGINLAKILRLYACAEPFIGYAVYNEATTGTVSAKGWENVVNRFEYGLGLGGGLELFKHVQVSVRYFWNFGTIYGANLKESIYSIGANSCNGLVVTGAILF